MRRFLGALVVLMFLSGFSMLLPQVRGQVRAMVRREAPAELTPLPVTVPQPWLAQEDQVPTAQPPESTPVATMLETASSGEPRPAGAKRTSTPRRPTATPKPRPSPTPVMVNGRAYDAYIPAAVKDKQAYQYSCEFDAAWVILRSYGIEASVDQLIGIVGVDSSLEPYIKETKGGFLIYGGDITRSFSGDYRKNFLARSSGKAMRKAFEHYGLRTQAVASRRDVEQALRGGALVWMKTTVDFKTWRPATWIMPDGREQRTVLGNDHAVVVMGFNAQGVVIRDVLGPTSSNRNRPYEYEVRWPVFLAAWEAQAFDGLAVLPPARR